jgi:hypothetical protein
VLILELTKYSDIPAAQVPRFPFVWESLPGIHTTADYWKNIMLCPDESIIIALYISSVIQAATSNYALMLSLADCELQELSFFFLVVTELLSIHYDHDENPWTENFQFGDQLGFTNKKDIYIDNVYYASLLKSVPQIQEQEDIIGYNKMAQITGNAALDNTADPHLINGRLDSFITRKLYGNDARLYNLDDLDGVFDFTRSDLEDLAAFTIDDYDLSLQECVVKFLDKRSAQDIDIPVDLFNATTYPLIDNKYVGKYIPLAYGLITASAATPTNGNAGAGVAIIYRQALTLSILGTVQVKIDEAWVTKVPTSTDLINGCFTLAAADCRNASNVPYDCRVLNSTGIPNTHSSDIIKDLNQRYLGILYTASAYDQTEWAAEEIALTSIGILFNKKIKLFEAIRQVRAGSVVRFRDEIKADGRRTIRIDDHDRDVLYHIPKEDINNCNIVPVKSRKDLLTSVVDIKYKHDYDEDTWTVEENDDNQDYVLQNYRQLRKLTEYETALTNQTDAAALAAWYAERYQDIPKIVSLDLRGKGYYFCRVYDIVTAELTAAFMDAASGQVLEGREYYGIWKIKLLSRKPSWDNLITSVEALLLEKVEAVTAVRITTTGKIRSCGTVGTATIKRGLIYA